MGSLPKMLIESEDAHYQGMSPFGELEHLRRKAIRIAE